MTAKGPSRQHRAAELRTLRDLRTSIINGRAMSLPTMLRLAKRRGVTDLSGLRALYMTRQPFRS